MSAQTPAPLVPLTAKQKNLVEGALPMADRLAQKVWRSYQRHGWLDRADVAAVGRAELVRAAQSYDDGRGVPFEAYAWQRIHGAMMNNAKKEIALAQGARGGAYRYTVTQRDEGNAARDTEEDQLAQMHALSDGVVAAMFCGLVGEVTRQSAARDEEAVVNEEHYHRAIHGVQAALKQIQELGPTLIRRCYTEGQSLKDAAEELGMSYATARRLHNDVLKRLGALLRGMGVTAAPEVAV